MNPHRMIRALLLAGIASLCCAPFPEKRPDLIPEFTRVKLDSVTVMYDPDVDLVVVQQPISGVWKGLGLGTARGLVAIPMLTVSGMREGAKSDGLSAIFGAALGAVMGILYFPVSVVAGPFTTANAEQTRAAAAAIDVEFESCAYEETFARMFVEAAQTIARESPDGRPRVTLQGKRSKSPRGPQASQGTTIVLKIVSIEMSGSREGWFTFNKRVPVIIQAEVRIEGGWNRRTVYETQLTYEDEKRLRRFGEWGADDAQALCQEIDRGLALIAERFAELIFLIRELPEREDEDENWFSKLLKFKFK